MVISGQSQNPYDPTDPAGTALAITVERESRDVLRSMIKRA